MKLTEKLLTQEVVRIQNTSNCNVLLHTLCDRVNDNSDVLNYEHPIIIVWLNKIASMIGGIQSDMDIAKTETSIA